MLENCTTIDSCESLLLDQVPKVGLLGQIPLTNNDFEMLCSFILEEFPYSNESSFQENIIQYPASVSCYLVLKGIFNYTEGSYWNSIREEIKDLSPSKNTLLGNLFLNFIDRNKLFHAEIPRSKKYITPILMHGIIPQEQVDEYFEKIIYPLVTKELIRPTDAIELSYWLEENRSLEREEEYLSGIDENLESLINEIPFLEPVDSDDIEKDIENLNQQITLIRNQLDVLNKPDDLIEKLTEIENDIDTVEKLEENLLSFKRKQEVSSSRIKTIQQSILKDPLYSVCSEEIPPFDTLLTLAETGLIDHLQSIAETGNTEEQDQLKSFLQAFSIALKDKKIVLSDEAMEKYLALISLCMVQFSGDEDDELFDITAAHAYGANAFNNLEIHSLDTNLNQIFYPETSGNIILLRIQSLYDIEDPSSFLHFNKETEMGDYLLAHMIIGSFSEGSTSSRELSPFQTPTANYERVFDSLALYEQEDSASLFCFDAETEMGDYLLAHTFALALNTPESHQIFRPDTHHQSNSEIYNRINSLYQIENEAIADEFHSDKSESLIDQSQKNSDLGKIAESISAQMRKEQKNNQPKEPAVKKQNIPRSPSLTLDTINKVRDAFLAKKSDTADFTDKHIQKHSVSGSDESTGKIDFGMQKIALERQPNPVKEENHSEFTFIQETEKETIREPENNPESFTEIKTNNGSNNRFSDPADSSEDHSQQGVSKTNLIQSSESKEKTNFPELLETYGHNNLTKESPVSPLQQPQISLTDETTMPIQLKKKPFLIRLIIKIFKKSK